MPGKIVKMSTRTPGRLTAGPIVDEAKPALRSLTSMPEGPGEGEHAAPAAARHRLHHEPAGQPATPSAARCLRLAQPVGGAFLRDLTAQHLSSAPPVAQDGGRGSGEGRSVFGTTPG